MENDLNDPDYLRKRVRELEEENARLHERISQLEAALQGRPAGKDEPQDNRAEDTATITAVDKYSSPQGKIRLFTSLFRGRQDVYAARWQSVKTGKSGYSPACANEWKTGVCEKPRVKCAECANRELLPVTDEVIYRHLSGKDAYGRDVVGAYPVLTDESCCFLAIDFDDGGWKDSVTAVRNKCTEWDIPCAVERSRSGEGAHIWFFYDEAVSCADARKLGTALLTSAMQSAETLRMSSYDRMIPNQDTLPKGGFGNLIALPLQGQARKKGNSEFVDENFISYPDQWAFLSSIHRISKDEFETALALHARGDVFGNLMGSDDGTKPWETKQPSSLSPMDFPPNPEIVKSNLLYLSMDGMSAKARNRLVRLAAFRNPEFYKAQAMRLPIYNKPRILNTAEERDGYLALPRGCEEALKYLLDSSSIPFHLRDERYCGKPIPAEFTGTLREEQQAAANAMLEKDIGVLSAATGFGKTVISAYMIGSRKVNTLIIVNTTTLLKQWISSLNDFLHFSETTDAPQQDRKRKKPLPAIGQLGGNKKNLTGIVDVATIQSLISGDEIKDTVRQYGMVIVDECHHVSAFTFEKVLKEVTARYVYGLSATPVRADGHHPIIFLQCGPIRYNVDSRKQAEDRGIDQVLIPRFTPYRTAVEEKGFTSICSDLTGNEYRNQMIADDVRAVLKQNRTPIILTERREHVETLASLLENACPNVIPLMGTASPKKRREMMDRLSSVPEDEPLAVIATGKIAGEGFDFPRLDTMLLATPVSDPSRLKQYVGRLNRSWPGKSEVHVYDYVDIHVSMLDNMYAKRLRTYSSLGYRIRTDTQADESNNLIYDAQNFFPVFCSDLKAAKKEILIVSPAMNRNRLKSIVETLSVPLINGVPVKVIVQSAEIIKDGKKRETAEADIKYLSDYGITVVTKDTFRQRFAVIDGRISWYGSVDFLSFSRSDNSVIRLEDKIMADELIDSSLSML